MAIRKITIQQLTEQFRHYPVLDVRSPGEYNHAHIPGAYSLPLFTDEERKVVGTIYKQQGKQKAIKAGLDFFSVKMNAMLQQAESVINNYEVKIKNEPTYNSQLTTRNSVIVHCWRGGMRSAGVAWLLDLYGFEVYTITGGYKAYRNWVLKQFEPDYDFMMIGGYTGSGKTAVIGELQLRKNTVINLEQLANHKGSAFGDMGEQPKQEMFENLLAEELSKYAGTGSIWLEDESQRIGRLTIPHSLWKTMRNKPVFFMDIPFEKRLDYILANYGLNDREKLVAAILRIQKRLGPLETKTAIAFLLEDRYKSCFEILLKYYDKLYSKALYNRENPEILINKITCPVIDSISNTEKLLSCVIVNT